VSGGAWTRKVLVWRVQAIGLAAVLTTALVVGTAPTVVASAPTAQATRQMQVLVIKYFPLTADGMHIDINVTGDVGDLLSVVQAKVSTMTTNVAAAMSEGTKYHGYVDPSAVHDIQFSIADTIEIHTAVPTLPCSDNPSSSVCGDYQGLLTDAGICDRVDNHGLDEVWIWAYHSDAFSESKMSGPYGDISNSYRRDDMPHCSHTYTVYTYDYGRTTAEAIHDHGHQIEAELSAIDNHLLYDLYEGTTPYPAGVATGRCGSVHNPPNARFEYDWTNPTPNPTDCLHWNPDGLGPTTSIGCATWGCVDNGDTDNSQRNWIVWWMQNMPGIGNTVTYHGQQMRDWWDVYYDFDAAMGTCPSLTVVCALQAPKAAVGTLPTFQIGRSINIVWGAVPGTGSVINYDVRVRKAKWNGGFGSYSTWKTAFGSDAATYTGAAGYTYCFSVRARDDLGSLSAWSGAQCTATPLDDRSLTRHGSWSAKTSRAYYGGTYLRSSTKDATLTLSGVAATRIAILARTCPGCGTVKVYWGSTLLKTISLNATTTTASHLITVKAFTSLHHGTLTIKVSSSHKSVTIDGIVIRRN
jgi:hypothetical protein